MRKAVFLLVLLVSCPVYADDLINPSSVNIPKVQDMNMSGLLSSVALRSLEQAHEEIPDYSLQRMKLMNPDFTTYPEASGIIWLKHTVISRAGDGGTEAVRLYVILGRSGLAGKWLNWNIPVPARGKTEVLRAEAYDFSSLAKVAAATTQEDTAAGVHHVSFQGLPDTFIIAVAWREELPEQLSIEGLCWFQEDLRVWEAITEVYSPQKLAYKTFPERRSPDVKDLNTETLYTWRRINLEPYSPSGELARVQRSGVAFSARQGSSGIVTVLKNAANTGNIQPVPEALAGFRSSPEEGTSRLIEWLRGQPEIELAEGGTRRIPSSGALTRREKILLARSWLNSQKVDASLCWQLPFEPDDKTPLCSGMFGEPVLEVQETFDDMIDARLIKGAKVFSLRKDGKLFSRRIPSSSAGSNRLSAVMDFRLNPQGFLSGTVRVTLRGAWEGLLLGSSPDDAKVRSALLSMFPGLTNYKDVKYDSRTKELSFAIDKKPGIAGTGQGILAILPFFEPVAMRRLGLYEPPVEVRYPFVIDQNITLGFPKNASEALVQGTTNKAPDKINFSSRYQNRRHRLIADARLEVNMPSVSSGNMSLLRRNLDSWRSFSAKNIPVR